MKKKSIWAVVAGVLFIVVVTTLVDIALHLVHVYPLLDQPMNDSLALLAGFRTHRGSRLRHFPWPWFFVDASGGILVRAPRRLTGGRADVVEELEAQRRRRDALHQVQLIDDCA
jgi:hypothetical protein